MDKATEDGAPGRAGWEEFLGDDEQILWQGAPDAGVVWWDILSAKSITGVFSIVFAVAWLNVTSAMVAPQGFGQTSLVAPMSPLFQLVGVGLVLMGLHQIVGRVIWDAYVRRHSWYTLTDRAAFIASAPLGRRRLKRLPLQDTRPVLDDDMPGTVWLGEDITPAVRTRTAGRRAEELRKPLGFRRIAEARRVHRLVTDARDAIVARG